jgi:hypothetical protein
MSAFSIVGGWLKSSEDFSIKVEASLPDKCSCLPDSFGNASKIPKVDGPSLIPNHAVVAGSSCTLYIPARSKFSTSDSLPGFTSSLTNSPTLTMIIFPFGRIYQFLFLHVGTTMGIYLGFILFNISHFFSKNFLFLYF